MEKLLKSVSELHVGFQVMDPDHWWSDRVAR
jgi:hypothetical protein